MENREIESEIAFAIVVACDELIKSFAEVETDNPYANLFTSQLKIGLGKTMQAMTKNLSQEHLNEVGKLLIKNPINNQL